MTDFHQLELARHCRVCGKSVSTGGTYTHTCTNAGDTLKSGLGINVDNDNPSIHPPSVCHTCYTKARQYASTSVEVQSSLCIQVWTPHSDENCSVCDLFTRQQKGGRPKKERKNRGRPQQQVILKNAPPSWCDPELQLTPSRFLPPSVLQLSDFCCPVCSCIVNRPVETPCHKLICAGCVASICTSDSACPSCGDSHQVPKDSFLPAPEMVLKVIGSLLFQCECTKVVELCNLKTHIESGCRASVCSASQFTVAQMLSRPLTSPPTAEEQRAATNVVKRMMHTYPGQMVQLPTDGQVKNLLHRNTLYITIHINFIATQSSKGHQPLH